MNELREEGIFSCRPILSVDNVARSLDYYRDVLGFKTGLTWSETTMSFLDEEDETHPT